MQEWLDTHKPAASRRTHLLLAASMWTIVGTALLVFGTKCMWQSPASRWLVAILLASAVFGGILKARLVLNRAADKIGARICERGDGYCAGGFLSPVNWGLVLVMMTAGRLFRAAPISIAIVGFVYATIGTALLLASRRLWCAWRKSAETAPI
jgi:uncharacterized membrane protein YqgA involved in biofilm formation